MSNSTSTSTPTPEPNQSQPLSYQTTTYQNGLLPHPAPPPPLPFNPLTWETLAQAHLSPNSYGYVQGSAGTGSTATNNLQAFTKWALVPSRLNRTPTPYADLRTRLFGHEYASPIAIAPVGVQRIFHPAGEKATAAAAGAGAPDLQVPYILSTATATSIEDVAAANGAGPRWFQLYWPGNEHDEITLSLLARAKNAGYSVLVVTLDTYVLGWRPGDLDHGYNPFLRADDIGVAAGFSDAVFRRRFRERHGVEVEEDVGRAAAEWAGVIFPGYSHGWEDVGFLRRHWEGPIVLKGIQSVGDAERAVEVGVQGVVVSNHGGRQLDGGVGSLTVLSEIVDAVGDRLEVLFDSGVRCGADVAKALALGAKMVLVGRPYVYGLAVGGEEGVRHVLRCLLGELQLTLHLAGVQSVRSEHLNRDVLRWVG
ncbi:putative FMN dependent dehydrogenase [Aspergillus heteromorphus CBS 117.55]|uniref:Putative FMN dependent dehydrogenase n=1 Tax=Aspergillus heteromorphus CBS 117.55 TaxID=1448321 RepID=A0A317WG97_9EURO|nr:putative FMN dependent dehydrogenase [Aspergillus heteromorphus CBS 117.55]PWY84995.1 putative FMN dependent dehydrogenase [Aspergillus heteromorphus CBS 117.55]